MKTEALEEAIGKISWGNTVLFLGAGFSHGATNLAGGTVLNGKGLRDKFLDLANITEEREFYDLQSAASEYEKENSSDIIRLLIENFTIKDVSDDHKAVARLKLKRIYTTNYDNCFYVASTQCGEPCVDLDLRDKIDNYDKNINQLIHIHGKVSNITRENYNSQFFLTEGQSRQIPFTVGHMATFFRSDLATCDSLIFIGYSLDDPHIRSILADHGEIIHRKTFFIGHCSDPKPLRARFQGYGTYSDIGLDGFADLLSRASQVPRPANSLPSNFRKLEFLVHGDSSVTRDRVRDEFLLGAAKDEYFSASSELQNKNPFYCDRVSNRFQNFSSYNGVLVFHGDTGNGKTTAAKQYLYKKFLSGSNVVQYTGGEVNLEDISRYLKRNGAVIVFIEDIFGHLKFINSLKNLIDSNIEIVLTSKTKDLEIRKSELKAIFPNMREFSINKLTGAEVERLVEILDENFLWGEYTEFDTARKKFVIQNTCDGEIRGVLFALFEGGAIRLRMDEIFQKLRSLNQDFFDLMCLNSLFNYSRIRNKEYFSRIGALDDLLNLRIDYNEFGNSLDILGVGELFDREQGTINFRSAILSKYFIINHLSIADLLALSLRALKNIEQYFLNDDLFYNDLSKTLLQFNLYREMFSKNDLRSGGLTIDSDLFHTSMWDFYQKCRVLKIAQNDPMFVIQLSMSHLSKGDFSTCYELIDAADKMYGRKGDKYHLETHKADVLLQESAARPDYQDFFNESEAFRLFEGVIVRRNDRYHPFGVARRFLANVSRHEEVLKKKRRPEVQRMLARLLELTGRFPNEYNDRYSLVRDVRAMTERMLRNW